MTSPGVYFASILNAHLSFYEFAFPITDTYGLSLSGDLRPVSDTQVNGKPLFFYWFRSLENIRAIAESESDLSQWIISFHLVN